MQLALQKCTMKGNVIQQWFGGGRDLTPIICLKKMLSFSSNCKTACDKHNRSLSKYKKQCDAYFWNAHRNEARNGGLFSIIVKK
jgi:coproporphyrinogen III oxidase